MCSKYFNSFRGAPCSIKMDDHIHIPTLLTSIAITSLLLLTTLPPSLSQQPLSNYSLCSQQPYECGGLFGVYYPFWGEKRPSYCGGGEQFFLTCESGQYTSIRIGSQTFEVEKIDAQAYTIKLVPLLPREYQFCSLQFNFSLRPLFWYSKSVSNITVFYNCPSGFSNDGSNFTCPDSGSENQTVVYYEGVVDEVLKQHPELKGCGRHVGVPTDEAAIDPKGGVDDQINGAIDQGFSVNYVVSQECLRCMGSEGACGTNETGQFTCYCPDGSSALGCPHSPQGKRPRPMDTPIAGNRWRWKFGHVVIGFIVTLIPGLMLICITICCFRCESSRWEEIFWLRGKSNQDVEAMLKNHGALTLKRYKFSDVKKMTNSFKVKLGQGGFGDVYKGKLFNGCHVAVKILNSSKRNGEEFINEVSSISRTSHINVVAFLGFCLEGSKKALIYEFMSNGSLDKFIYKKGNEMTPSLTWDHLYQIAIGIARGLEYLHRGCNTRILHFDIKPHNILLDENFCPKISDFGLAKLCPRKESTVSMSNARGTIGYVAPEVWNKHFGGVSHKSDVYSYGMMLLEIVGGRKNINAEASHTSEIYFPNWIYRRLEQGTQLVLDGEMVVEENEVVKRMTMVGLWCIQTIPNNRPTMSKVLDMLGGNIEFLEMPPKPLLSSPVRSGAESFTVVN